MKKFKSFLGFCRMFSAFAVVLSLGVHISTAQQIAIEFIDRPLIYPIGQFGEGEGVFAPFTRSLNKDSIRQVIRMELKKYPKGLLENKARLAKILLSDTMFVKDEKGEFTKAALGTYLVPAVKGNIVFLNGTDKLLPAALHHEISSIFLYELAIKDSVYRERTDKMFRFFSLSTLYHYEDEKIYADIKANDNWPPNQNNFFVLGNSGYALMDEENDFNKIVESLFSATLLRANGSLLIDQKRRLWEFLKEAKSNKYEVYQKVMMVIDYYHALDASFNEAYFRNLER